MTLSVLAVGLGVLVQFTPSPLQFFTGQFLELALVFFAIAIVAAVLGARGIAGLSMAIAKWIVIAFVILALFTLIL